MKTKSLAAAILVLIAGASLTAIAQRTAVHAADTGNPQASVTATRHGGTIEYSETPTATEDVSARASSVAITATRAAGGVHISRETLVAQDGSTASSTKTCTDYSGQIVCN